MGLDITFKQKEKIFCPKCGEFVLSHRVCKKCRSYNGKEVIKEEA